MRHARVTKGVGLQTPRRDGYERGICLNGECYLASYAAHCSGCYFQVGCYFFQRHYLQYVRIPFQQFHISFFGRFTVHV